MCTPRAPAPVDTRAHRDAWAHVQTCSAPPCSVRAHGCTCTRTHPHKHAYPCACGPRRAHKRQDFDLSDALDDSGTKSTSAPKKPSAGDDFSLEDAIGGHSGFSDSDLIEGNSGGGESQGVVPGIIGAVVVAVAGAISSFIAYQKKKLCFKENADQGEVNMENHQSTNAEPPGARPPFRMVHPSQSFQSACCCVKVRKGVCLGLEVHRVQRRSPDVVDGGGDRVRGNTRSSRVSSGTDVLTSWALGVFPDTLLFTLILCASYRMRVTQKRTQELPPWHGGAVAEGQGDFDLADALDDPGECQYFEGKRYVFCSLSQLCGLQGIYPKPKPPYPPRPASPDHHGGGIYPPPKPPPRPQPGTYDNSGGFLSDKDLDDGRYPPRPRQPAGGDGSSTYGNPQGNMVAKIVSPIVSVVVVTLVGAAASYFRQNRGRNCFRTNGKFHSRFFSPQA
ncbi:hypothetical protein CB1_001076009 [Camelus ferus]|nr:hypothetical protein CB1_001076009 [Camelus ferus]